MDVESDRASGTDKGDGAAFIELSINEEWQLTSGSVLSWTICSSSSAVRLMSENSCC